MNAASDKPRSTRSAPRSLTVAALLVMASASQAHAERRTTYYHTDALGSVVAASDQSGALLWRKQYAPFGEQLDLGSAAGAGERLAYTGKQHDSVLGLTNFGARHYDPHIGRFVSVDPAGFDPSNPASFNRYAYVNNNPYKYVDPDGEILNFAAKFVLDVGINIAFNYVTTGQLNVGGALKESAVGILNPAKTLTKAAKLGKALAKGAKAAAPAKQAARGADPAGRRVKLRKSTLEEIEARQPRNSAGEMVDPHSARPLKPDEIDVGHKPGQEWRRRQRLHRERKSTRQEVLDAENDPDIYHLEDRSSNRGHKHEQK